MFGDRWTIELAWINATGFKCRSRDGQSWWGELVHDGL